MAAQLWSVPEEGVLTLSVLEAGPVHYPLISLLDNCSGNKPHPVLKEEKGKGSLQEGRSRTDGEARE